MKWLDSALKKEKEKYEKCPLKPDLIPSHEVAQAWGYVVAGYFLVESSIKALLYVRGKTVPRKYTLTILLDLLEPEDQEMLRKNYNDYKASIGGRFPYNALEAFLANLDGDSNEREDDFNGSFDWRYFLIEEPLSRNLPLVRVEFLHEIVFGCVRIIVFVHYGRFEPSQYTYSNRLNW
ncbi:MAG: hypothetical protein F4X08_06105 [Gemmatimonadetes bacterium]|nr:hypothetical protein [Gemmatimonadota bacterium]MYD25365.1 hypothetical protein [Gemmatimonadota bacterium]